MAIGSRTGRAIYQGIKTGIAPKEKIKAIERAIRDPNSKLYRDTSERLVVEFEMGMPFIEKATGIVWVRSQIVLDDREVLESLTANIYVEDDILQFLAVTYKKRGETVWPKLERTLRTIENHRD